MQIVRGAVTAFGNNSWYRSHWCNADGASSLQYLDDKNCAKKFPSVFDRELKCKSTHLGAPLPGYFKDMDFDKVLVNTTALRGLSIPNLNVVNLALILVRRLKNGAPTFKYIGNGRERIASETWSSSKLFAVADGAGTLQEQCKPSVGALNAYVDSKHGEIPLGDLATVIVSYDATAGCA